MLKGCSVETGADIGGTVDWSTPIRPVCIGFDISSPWPDTGPLFQYAKESLDGSKESVPAVVVPETRDAMDSQNREVDLRGGFNVA